MKTLHDDVDEIQNHMVFETWAVQVETTNEQTKAIYLDMLKKGKIKNPKNIKHWSFSRLQKTMMANIISGLMKSEFHHLFLWWTYLNILDKIFRQVLFGGKAFRTRCPCPKAELAFA